MARVLSGYAVLFDDIEYLGKNKSRKLLVGGTPPSSTTDSEPKALLLHNVSIRSHRGARLVPPAALSSL